MKGEAGMKFIALLFVASAVNGAGWWTYLIAQSNGVPPYLELIQLGGTGGLIVTLLLAVVALWKDRGKLQTEWRDEVDRLRQMIADERAVHRDEIASMRQEHQADLAQLSEEYTQELKDQISTLRTETQNQMTHERKVSDEKYQSE